MAQSTTEFRLGPERTPPVILRLIIATAIAWAVQLVLEMSVLKGSEAIPWIDRVGALQAERFWSGYLWQPLTAMFMHGDLNHLFGNMFALWMFGSSVEPLVGGRRFLRLYIGGGVAVGFVQMLLALAVHTLETVWPGAAVVARYLFIGWENSSLGASGAVFLILTIYCISFPDRVIQLLFLPIGYAARWFIPITIFSSFAFWFGGVNHTAHLLGILFGYLFVRYRMKRGGVWTELNELLNQRRRAAERARFRVLRPPPSEDGGPLIH